MSGNLKYISNAKIYYRILPIENSKFDYVKIHEDAKTVYCRALQDFSKGYEKRAPRYWTFGTDGVFVNNTQEDIYNAVASPVLERVKDGYNAVIFCFGQTGTGKTLTSVGSKDSERDFGFGPRIMEDLFKFKETSGKQVRVHLLLSCIETHRGYFTDLLQPHSGMMDHNCLKNVRAKKIRSASEGIVTLQRANGRRKLSLNSPYASNKGNGIFTFHVVKKYLQSSKPTKIQSTLHVIDLAGADTFGNLSSFYKGIFDVANGNLAKTQLEQYLLILTEGIPEKIHVKQHLNILIKYLCKWSFDLHCILRFVGHLRLGRDNLPITISMLRFGQIIRNLRTKRPLKSEALLESPSVLLLHLKDKMKQLRTEQQLENMYLNNAPAILNKERIEQMRNITNEYLQNNTNELVMMNVTEANSIFKIFKNMFNEYKAEMSELQKIMYDKGYAEAMAKIEAANMKADSSSSLKGKGSRRSIKSKESAKGKSMKEGRKASKTSSLSKVSEKSLELTVIPSGERVQQKTERKSKESLKQSIKSEKLLTETATEEVADDIIEGGIIIPKEIPTYETAWNEYVNEKSCRYEEHLQLVKNMEENAKAIYQEYSRQVKAFQETAAFLQLAMQMNLEKLRREEETADALAENMYDNNFGEIQQRITEQQENLLKCEAELKLTLGTHYNAKRCISKGFDAFCMEKFGTVLPAIKMRDD